MQDFLDITLITDEELEKAFLKCDKDGSGAIEIGEVRRACFRGRFWANFRNAPRRTLCSSRPY